MKIVKTLAFVFLTALVCITFKMLTIGMVASPVEAVSKTHAGGKGHEVDFVALDMGSFSCLKVSTFYDLVVEYDPAKAGKVCYRVSKDYKDLVMVEVVNGLLTFSTKKTVGATKFKNWEKKISKISVYTNEPLQQVVVEGSGDIEIRSNVPLAQKVTFTVSGSGDVEVAGCQTESINVIINGSGDVEFEGATNISNFNVQIEGSGDIEAENLNAASTSILINGSGDITLKGESQGATITVNGSGDINCGELLCNTVEAKSFGSGDIDIYAKETLNAQASGSGCVKIYGNPASKTTNGNKNNIIFK